MEQSGFKIEICQERILFKPPSSKPQRVLETSQVCESKSNTLPALEHGNTVATSSSDQEKANLLNKVFINSFNHSTPILESTDLPSTDPNWLPEPLMCTEDEVFEMLSTLDTTKSSGHDEISTKMLEEIALSMTPAVTSLFNMLISLGVLPDKWKIGRVSPVPKSSTRSDPTNYRPIPLLSILRKLLEKHMRDAFY